MDQRLYNATIRGDIESLLQLIQQDALILDGITAITNLLETPLHIAAILGHEQFANELLKLKPRLTSELDRRRSSPLHLASLKGHTGIVKNLLSANPDMCFVCDRDGRNPLHVAAMMGRHDALKEMLLVKPDAARALVNRGETILHLCVKYCQLEVLKLLLNTTDFQELVNRKDKNGNTILHLSVADSQVETTEFLLSVAGIEVNALNHSGMTAMEILIQRKNNTRNIEMEESLKHAGAFGVEESSHPPPNFRPRNMGNQALFMHPDQRFCSSRDFQENIWKKILKNKDDWLEKKRDAMMVVATLIAGMAFEVGVSPPEGVWQKENNALDLENSEGVKYYLTITYVYLRKYVQFYMVNTISFIASLSIIFLLMSGLPLKHKVFMWIFTVITWIAITAIALTYTISLILLTPSSQKNSTESVIGITVFVWICLMALLLIGHTIRLSFKMIKTVMKALTLKRRKPS